MELAYQGLFIRLPFEGAVGVEAFEMNASFNDHVTLRLLLLVEEEKIEALIHGIGDGDDIEVYKAEADGLLYAGKITDAKMEQDRSLHLLQLEAASYTMEWGLAPVSQSFLNLDTTYRQVMDKVLKNQKDAEILDCATKGAVSPDFLLQYEEFPRASCQSFSYLYGTGLPCGAWTGLFWNSGSGGRICPER